MSLIEKMVDGEQIQITNKNEIEQKIARCNKDKLLQVNNTPLCAEPLLSLLGEQGDFDTWEKILKGQVQLPEEGMEEGTRQWFNFMTTAYPEEIELNGRQKNILKDGER